MGSNFRERETGRRLARLRILPDPYRKSVAGHLLAKTHVGAVATSADGADTVALGCWDVTAKLLDPATGEVVELARPHSDNVNFVAFAGDGRRTPDRDLPGDLEWDTAGRAPIRTIPLDRSEHWTHIAIDGGDRVVSIASRDPLSIWDVASWTSQAYPIDYKGPPSALAYSPRDQLLAIGLKGKSVLFWDAADRRPIRKVKVAEDMIQALAFAPNLPALCVLDARPSFLVEHEYRR